MSVTNILCPKVYSLYYCYNGVLAGDSQKLYSYAVTLVLQIPTGISLALVL